MDVSMKSESRLDVSVSFGRYANDALSWEKWSSFSPNKYLEEIGSLSTPGSVAQKKAYFEAHYKKISAHKAVMSGRENLIAPDVSSNDAPGNISSDMSNESVALNDAKFVEEVIGDSCLIVSSSKGIAKHTEDVNELSSGGISFAARMYAIASDGERVNVPRVNLLAKDEPGDSATLPEFNAINDSGLDIVDSHQILSDSGKNTILEKSVAIKAKKSNLNQTGNTVRKSTTVKKETCSAGSVKKVVSSSKQLPARTNLKSVSTSTPTSDSQASKKKVNGSPQQRSKTLLARDSKKIAPTSLHLSLNSGPAASFVAHSTLRKSSVLENMGDKDIVRRAFKTFNKRDDASVSAEKAYSSKHVSGLTLQEFSSPPELKRAISRTPVKGNEGLNKESEKITTRTASSTRSNPLPGSHKKYEMGSSPRVSTIEKPRELPSKLRSKPNLNVAGNAKQSEVSKASCKAKAECPYTDDSDFERLIPIMQVAIRNEKLSQSLSIR